MDYIMVLVVLAGGLLVHETGHFLAAMALGLPVARASIGFGPALFSKTIRGTEYRISWIPFAGYILPAYSSMEEYFLVPRWKRILFALGGPLLNALLAVMCFFVFAWLTHKGTSLPDYLVFAMTKTISLTQGMFKTLAEFRGGEFLGPMGFIVEGSKAIAGDFSRAIAVAGLVSVNLCLLNLLPIPAFDGGKVVLALAESIFPRTVEKLHMPVSLLSLGGILILLAAVTVHDIIRLA